MGASFDSREHDAALDGAARSSGVGSVRAESAPPLAGGFARLRYHRLDGDYHGWSLHCWGDTSEHVTWTLPLLPEGEDEYGIYWDLELLPDARRVGFVVHRGDEKDPGADLFLELGPDRREFWMLSGQTGIHHESPDVGRLALGCGSHAQWLDAETIVWNVEIPPGGEVRLHWAGPDGLRADARGVRGEGSIVLSPNLRGPSEATRFRYPHLSHVRSWRIEPEHRARIAALLKQQLAVSVCDATGRLRDATGVQLHGVLDDLFAHEGPLGTTWNEGCPTLRVWAPTARSVNLHLFESSEGEESRVIPLIERRGVWSVTGTPEWRNRFHLLEVEVFAPSTGRFERNLVTDPYSRSLSLDSRRSQFVDLDDPELAPEGWLTLEKPPLVAVEDIVLYELHVRDFSSLDEETPEKLRGTYLGFTVDSPGTRHLRELARSGLTHVHLLPCFDFASVGDDRTKWRHPGDLSGFASDSEEQQARVNEVRGEDGYNWGYDPLHFGVPEGSYSTDPDGSTRVLEFREMVRALAESGLRVVMDVVYNHTWASGQSERSVLDRVVPGYYHRLSESGEVETSTCCPNTASEHRMMERLIVDDVLHWARDFKIDGFRFDLMGHHMKRTMTRVRDALASLSVERDGVDGSSIYVYGEGWDFGEVAGGARGENASQRSMAGTGIGTFNDRHRDALRGGDAFGDRRTQGFVTGLFVQPSAWGRAASGGNSPERLLTETDRLRVGLAGALRDFRFVDRSGFEVRGADHGHGGYTESPREAVNYASCHDNETLFDKIQFAASEEARLEERVRMHRLALALVALGQGIPFFHAGCEMLRSKSFDRDSYASGDWFNRLDFTYRTNNFGSGLPIADKNRERWDQMRYLLADESLRPGSREITGTVHCFREMLRIRKSSPLFRLRSAAEVQARLRFHNTGPGQLPGLILMELDDCIGDECGLDGDHARIVVGFNAAPRAAELARSHWQGGGFVLHPVQRSGADELVISAAHFDPVGGRFVIPPRSCAVFVEPR